MPAAIPYAMREVIWAHQCAGRTVADIAAATDLPYWTVRRLVRRQRAAGGPVAPAYDRCRTAVPRSSRRVIRVVHWLKRRHPTWGAEFIRTILAERWPQTPLPSARTIQRWWRATPPTGTPPAPVDRPPAQPPQPRASAPHQVWQLDAVEQATLADGSGVSWLTITDEATGAVLSATAFPPTVLEPGAAAGHSRSDREHDDPVGNAGHDPGR